jgi:hypothetical protein
MGLFDKLESWNRQRQYEETFEYLYKLATKGSADVR